MTDVALSGERPRSPATRDVEPRGRKPRPFFTLPKVLIYSVLILSCLFYLFCLAT